MKADHMRGIVTILLIFLLACPSYAQQVVFNRVLPPKGKTFEHITGIVQDKYGYMWFASKRGLFKSLAILLQTRSLPLP